jgi:cytochrome c oxidase assembly protein Cox11
MDAQCLITCVLYSPFISTMYMMIVLSFAQVPCYFKIYRRLDNKCITN